MKADSIRKLTTDIDQSILDLTMQLIRIPSRSQEDDVCNIVAFLESWLEVHGLAPKVLHDSMGNPLAIYLNIGSGNPSPSVCLDACIDTAPFGDEHEWTFPPSSATLKGRRLYGRGAADSKVAVSIFCHLAIELSQTRLHRGRVFFLFDGDEHTGGFQGVKRFLDVVTPAPSAFVIGYPGNYGIIVGARGFYRAEITTFGIPVHSGSKDKTGVNAIVKMASMIERIRLAQLPEETDLNFSFGPKATVTAVKGGNGYSQIPDTCSCNVDIRLTPHFDERRAMDWLSNLVREIDILSPSPKPTLIEPGETWPAYRLDDDLPIVRAFVESAQQSFHRSIPTVVCGPSNIGNFLATRKIPAICGFGVTYKNIHSINEYVEIDSIAPVYETYRNAILHYLVHSQA